MGAKYTTNSTFSGYNSSPPADDGSQVATNLITWAKHKTKLSDPIKTEATNIDSDLVTAFDYTPRRITTSDTVVADDHMRIVEIAPTATTSVVVTLPDAGTLGTLFRCYIKNSSAHSQTIARATVGDTIDGVASDLTILPKTGLCIQTNNNASAVADGFLIPSWFNRQPLPAGIGPLPYAGSTVPAGWLECDGSAVSRTTYAALFTAISTTWGAGNGSTTFNLPDMRGKVAIGSGTGTVVESGVDAAVDLTDNELDVASNNTKWVTGMAVVFTLASGTITGLTSGNTYYIIRMSATAVSLAGTLADAQNGVEVDFTAKSSPVWTLTHTYTARTLGQYGGEESHAMSSTELLAHTHTENSINGAGGNAATGAGAAFGNATSGSAGGNAAMNTMQPFAVTKYIITY